MNIKAANTEGSITEEMLLAYVDGALSPEDAAKVVVCLVDHPAEQARVEAMMSLNETLARAYDAPMQEPVPQAIHDAIMQNGAEKASPGAHVIPFPRAKRATLLAAGMALAATVALAVMVAPHLRRGQDAHLAVGPVAAGGALETVLNDYASGREMRFGDGSSIVAVASFASQRYGLCREIEHLPAARNALETAIVCARKGEGWHVELATAVPGAVADKGFVPAQGEKPDMVAPFLDAIGAGFALAPKQEAQAIKNRWQPPDTK